MSRDKWGHEDNARISELEKGVGHLTTENIAKGLMVESLAARVRVLEGVIEEVREWQEGLPATVDYEWGSELEAILSSHTHLPPASPLPKEQNHE